MSLQELGMKYVNSFIQSYGTDANADAADADNARQTLQFMEHFPATSTTPARQDTFSLESESDYQNIYPFTSIADIKRMLWIDKNVGGANSYKPKFIFMAWEKDGKYIPIEFYWGADSGLPAILDDPYSLGRKPNSELVDSEGNRRSVSPRMNLFITLEDSIAANKPENLVIHIWRLNQIIDYDNLTRTEFDGFVRLYFPWLNEMTEIDEGISNDPTDDPVYETCVEYITDRQQQLDRLQQLLEKNAAELGLVSCRGIDSLHLVIPKITPRPESLEILFYELGLSSALPYLRYFSERGGQEPIMRYLKNVYLPPEVLSHWIKEIPETKDEIVIGKILIRGTRIPVGSAFDLYFFKDNSNLVRLESNRKDVLYPGTLVEEGLSSLAVFLERNPFEKELPKIKHLHGKFVWEHPDINSNKPSMQELKERAKQYSHIFEVEPDDPKFLKLRYRAVSNYESENEILKYISRNVVLEIADTDYQNKETVDLFTDRIMKRFARSKEQAVADFTLWLQRKGEYQAVAQGKGEEAVPLYHDGVIISIQNNHPSYEIEIANVQEQTSFSRILTSLAIMLIEKPTADEIVKAAGTEVSIKIIEKENTESKVEGAEYTRAPAAIASTADEGLNYFNLLGVEEGEEGEEGEELEANLEQEGAIGTVSDKVAKELAPEDLASRSEVAPSQPVQGQASQLKEVLGDVSKFYISKLKQLDIDLFGYQDKRAGKSKGYSSACQTSNGDMPHSLSPSQYKRVKEIYKDKITFIEGPKPKTWKLSVDYPTVTPDWLFDTKFNPRRPVWTTLQTGSHAKKNWYLCSKYWCIRDDLPLIESEYELNKQCPFCGGTEIKGKSPAQGETVLVRVTDKGYKRFIGFQTESKHPEGFPLPCCGKLPKESRLVDKTRPYASVSNAAVADDASKLPEGVKEELAEEKALASVSRAAPPPNKIEDILLKMQGKYIKSAGKYPLGPNELGVVPKQIDDLFGQDSSKAIKKDGPQQMLTRDQIAFVRFGLQNNDLKPGDRFLSMLGFLMGTFNINAVIEKMETTAFVHAFEDANYGTLVHEFARPDLPLEPRGTGFQNFITKYGYEAPSGRPNIVRLYYAYENFMSYVKDPNTVKDMRYFEHLLMMNGVFLKRGVLVFRIERYNDEEEWQVQCPHFGIPNMKEAPIPVFIIHDPKYHYWEPLVLYTGENQGIVGFDDKELITKLSPVTRVSLMNWIRSIKEQGCERKETPPYSWVPPATDAATVPSIARILREEVRPTFVVRERGNRFVGFVYKSHTGIQVFVPARDDGSRVHQYPRIYESKALPAPPLQELLAYYNENGFSAIEGLKPVEVLASTTTANLFVAVRLESGAVVPIEGTNDSLGLNSSAVGPDFPFPWSFDETLFPVTTPTDLTLDFQTADSFLNEAYQYLRLILSHHFTKEEEGEKVLANLQILRTPPFNLPLWERQKRAEILLGPVVHRFVKETPYVDRLIDLPRIRKDCSVATTKDQCGTMCSWSSEEGKCYLHAPKSDKFPNPERIFTARLVDEVLRNPYLFKELSTGKVSSVRPLKGTIQTETEIITTEGREHVRDLQDLGLSKIQKTKYTHGYRFIEEEPASLEVLRAVLGITKEADAKAIIDQMSSTEQKSLQQGLPIGWNSVYSILDVSPELEDSRLMLGLVKVFSDSFRKPMDFDMVKAEIKKYLTMKGSPSDFNQSPQDFFAISAITRLPLVKVSTALNGEPVLEMAIKPEVPNLLKGKLLIIWNNNIVFDKTQKVSRHDRFTAPDSLKKLLDKAEIEGTIIDKFENLVPLAPTLPSATLATAALATTALAPSLPVVAQPAQGNGVEEKQEQEKVEEFEPVGAVEQRPDELIDLQPKPEEFEPASLAGTVNAPVQQVVEQAELPAEQVVEQVVEQPVEQAPEEQEPVEQAPVEQVEEVEQAEQAVEAPAEQVQAPVEEPVEQPVEEVVEAEAPIDQEQEDKPQVPVAQLQSAEQNP